MHLHRCYFRPIRPTRNRMKSIYSFFIRQLGPRSVGILRTGGYGLLAKAATTLNLIFVMPFVRETAGPASFGAWATLVSVATVAAFLDFGLSSGAMNLIAGAHGRGNREEVSALARRALKSLYATAILLAIVGLLATALAPWHTLLGLGSGTAISARTAAAVAIASMVASVPAGLALRVQLGTGKASTGYRYATIGQLAGCLATIVATKMQASLPLLVACTLWPPVLASILNTAHSIRQYSIGVPHNHPIPGRELANQIRRESWLFLILQISAVLVVASDLPLISSLVSAEEAGRYAIAQRLFALIPLGLGLIWTPLWPAYRQALARNEYDWVVRVLRWSAWVAFATAGVAASTLALQFGEATMLWMGAPLDLPMLLLAGFASWAVFDAVGGAYGTFLNAISPRWFLITISSTFAGSSLILKAWLASQGRVELMPWATLACFLAFDMLPFTLFWPRLKRQMRETVF